MVNDLQVAVHSLIKKYCDRQSIVLDALRDLRPDMVMRLEGNISGSEYTEMRLKYAKEPGRGYWGNDNEWAYRLHGIGCHLTHTQTGEIIGWDIGSLRRFDFNWFVDHLKWSCQFDAFDPDVEVVRSKLYPNSKDLRQLRDLITEVFIQLSDTGYIKPARESHRFILIRE